MLCTAGDSVSDIDKRLFTALRQRQEDFRFVPKLANVNAYYERMLSTIGGPSSEQVR